MSTQMSVLELLGMMKIENLCLKYIGKSSDMRVVLKRGAMI